MNNYEFMISSIVLPNNKVFISVTAENMIISDKHTVNLIFEVKDGELVVSQFFDQGKIGDK